MKRVMIFFLCFLFYASVSNAQVMVKKERATNGRTHHSFSNTNVNTDEYDNEIESRTMSAAERVQADAIERANKVAQVRERQSSNRRMVELEQARLLEKRMELIKSMEKVNKLGKKYNINSFDDSIKIQSTNQPRNIIDVTTGRQMIPVAGGIIDPGTGTFHTDVGGGYVNSETGTFSPKFGP